MTHRLPARGPIAAALVLATWYAAFGSEPGEKRSVAATDFHFDQRDGSSYTASLSERVRIKTPYGVEEIYPQYIRRISFHAAGEGPANDTIELTDKHRIVGQVDRDSLTLPAGRQASEVREMRPTQKPSTGLLAIVIGLVTLTAMEIVLGIDNIIFLAIVVGKLPPAQQPRARKLGLALALGTRLLLLATLSFLLGLTKPVFTLPHLPLLEDIEAREVSLRDLILLGGGLFLIAKSVKEMHEKFEAAGRGHEAPAARPTSFVSALVYIAVLDIVFSLDSVITAVGMVEDLWVMAVAMVLAMLVMLVFAGSIGAFVDRHPTLKVLALAFLILIGVLLVAEALGQHMNKGYIYFAMAFSVVIEMINLRVRRKVKPAAIDESGKPSPGGEAAVG